MSDIVIAVEGLGKKYRIGMAASSRYLSLRESLANQAKALGRRLLHRRRDGDTRAGEMWAVADVSFAVRRGECLGIIGRNGAGKSTLLKLLSRITEPSAGRFRVRGRVASLLEVGTGFHPELTGRENIYLNGAVLGMRRAEVKRKFDEIVAFADVDRFLDTPVKRYSSGMYMRLAFAVAAHLEPEILVVDEVLAVGDAAFQRKCLSRMEQVAQGGRTILFVSHNMQAVRNLCHRCLLLSGGRVTSEGTPGEVVAHYYEDLRRTDVGADTAISSTRFRRGSGQARFVGIRIHDVRGEDRYEFAMGESIRFTLGYQVFHSVRDLYAMVILKTPSSGETVTSARFTLSPGPVQPGHSGEFVVEFPDTNLRPGEYPLYFWLGDLDDRAYDVVDELSAPLMIRTDKTRHELGFDPGQAWGVFSIAGHMLSNQIIN